MCVQDLRSVLQRSNVELPSERAECKAFHSRSSQRIKEEREDASSNGMAACPLFLAEKPEAGVAASHARWTAGAQGNGCGGGF